MRAQNDNQTGTPIHNTMNSTTIDNDKHSPRRMSTLRTIKKWKHEKHQRNTPNKKPFNPQTEKPNSSRIVYFWFPRKGSLKQAPEMLPKQKEQKDHRKGFFEMILIMFTLQGSSKRRNKRITKTLPKQSIPIPRKVSTIYSRKGTPKRSIEMLPKQKEQKIIKIVPSNYSPFCFLKLFPRNDTLKTLHISKPIIARYTKPFTTRTIYYIHYSTLALPRKPIRKSYSKHHHKTLKRNNPIRSTYYIHHYY